VAKFGEIMPAPFAWALSRTVPDGSRTLSAARFSNASVVWIAAEQIGNAADRRRNESLAVCHRFD